jgi:hypothetical protein
MLFGFAAGGKGFDYMAAFPYNQALSRFPAHCAALIQETFPRMDGRLSRISSQAKR